MTTLSGHCIDTIHTRCTFPRCTCVCHTAADECRDEFRGEWAADLRMDGDL